MCRFTWVPFENFGINPRLCLLDPGDFGLISTPEFRRTFQADITVGVPKSCRECPFASNDQATCCPDRAFRNVFWREIVLSRIEVELDGSSVPFGGKVKRDVTASWERLVSQVVACGLDADGGIQIECPECELKAVTTEVGNRTTAKVVPAAPLPWMVDLVIVRACWCGTEPEIPVEPLWNGITGRGTINSVGPGM